MSTVTTAIKLLERPISGKLARVNKVGSQIRRYVGDLGSISSRVVGKTLSVRPLSRMEDLWFKTRRFVSKHPKLIGIGGAAVATIGGLTLFHFLTASADDQDDFMTSDDVNRIASNANHDDYVSAGYGSLISSTVRELKSNLNELTTVLETGRLNKYDDTNKIFTLMVNVFDLQHELRDELDVIMSFNVPRMDRLIELGIGSRDDDFDTGNEKLSNMMLKDGADTDIRSRYDSVVSLITQVSFA